MATALPMRQQSQLMLDTDNWAGVWKPQYANPAQGAWRAGTTKYKSASKHYEHRARSKRIAQ